MIGVFGANAVYTMAVGGGEGLPEGIITGGLLPGSPDIIPISGQIMPCYVNGPGYVMAPASCLRT